MIRNLPTVFGAGLLLVLPACHTSPPGKARQQVADQGPPPAFDESKLPVSEEPVDAPLSSPARAMTAGEVQFAGDLYSSLSGDPGDMFVSPASIWSAFGLAHAATAGSTAQDIADVLHYPKQVNTTQSNGDLLKTMNFQFQGRSLMVRNAIWLQNSFPVKPAFENTVKTHFGAALMSADFAGSPDTARGQINQWIAAQTRNRIRDAIQPADVTTLTRTVLVNTAYFNARWRNPFEPMDTKVEDFIRADGSRAKAPLMNQRTHFSHMTGTGFQALALPYKWYETEMDIILPDQPNGLPALEGMVANGKLPSIIAGFSKGDFPEVILSLPKFRMAQRYELNGTMAKLGMASLFSAPDFSAMTDERLAMGNVIHQTMVAVDEIGTEATAATVDDTAGAAANPPKPITFRADHPFLFLIRDTRTGMILFMGRYTGMALK